MEQNPERLDVVGYWTEIKLQILQDYAKEYAKILSSQKFIKHAAYIDGFAGAGAHISKESGEIIQGSPARALAIEPRFSHYHFIEMREDRVERLRKIGSDKSVTVYQGDCNEVLLKDVFPQCRYEDFRRGLCLLDPYKLNPNWEVVETAGRMKSIEIFLNFMIMDANMNALKNNPDAVTPEQSRNHSQCATHAVQSFIIFCLRPKTPRAIGLPHTSSTSIVIARHADERQIENRMD